MVPKRKALRKKTAIKSIPYTRVVILGLLSIALILIILASAIVELMFMDIVNINSTDVNELEPYELETGFHSGEDYISLYRDTRDIPGDHSKMTVVITTYKQPICLERMILLLRSCPVVAEIRVNWFLEDEEPKTYNDFSRNNPYTPVIFDKYPNKLSYRFHPRNFTTDAVFSLDVDTFYSCESLTMALNTWKRNENSAVGFHGRYLTYDGYSWDHSFKNDFEYNTVFITKGGITHRKMFDEYFKEKYKKFRDEIDAAITAEDIFMSFLLDLTKTNVIMSCTEEHSICHVDCNQNEVLSLNNRTSDKRDDLIKKFYDHFGNDTALKVAQKGSRSVVWQGGKVTKVCMSKNSKNQEKYKNTPHCEDFCSRNLICPSNVYG